MHANYKKKQNEKTIKIAFLIMAHNDIEQLNLLLKQILAYSYAKAYIHIDKKSQIPINQIIKDKRIIVVNKRLETNWGDYSQILALKMLYETAIRSGNFDFYSVHSGADIATKPIEEYAAFLKRTKYDAYVDTEKMPVRRFGGCRPYERIGLRYPRFMRQKLKKNSVLRYIRAIYLRTYRHNNKLFDYYFGSSWHTVSKKCALKMLKYIHNNPNFDDVFIYSLCGDEIYWNTIINRLPNITIYKSNLRYIKWGESATDAGSPKTLTEEDYRNLLDQKYYFARKIDTKISEKLIHKILETQKTHLKH